MSSTPPDTRFLQAGPLTVESFFDPATSTFTHLLVEPVSRECAVVDSVLDYDPASGRTSTVSAGRVAARIREQQLTVRWHLETHVHADHLSAAAWLKDQLGGQIVIGQAITTVQDTFGRLFHEDARFARDGRQFDRLLADGEVLMLGEVPLRAMHTPGHTPACMTYVADTAQPPLAFVGDTLFMPDYGTARCDFPGGDAATLYRSIQQVLALPPQTLLLMCHDYPPGGREVLHLSTVAEQRQANVHVHDGVDQDAFVAMRQARDAGLKPPALLLPSVQVNMRAGRLPEPADNGVSYLKIPLNVL